MAKHVDSSIKQTILLEIKNGTTVPEVCAKYGVCRNSVYRWVQDQADNTGTSALEIAKLRRENQELKELVGIFALKEKRAEKISAVSVGMKAGKFTVAALAKRIGVSRSAMYYRPKKSISDDELRQKIILVMEKHPAYGSRRGATELKTNRKGIKRVMYTFGLRPRIRRGFRPAKPDDQNKPETHIPNILKQICPFKPNIVWAGDFTYFWFQDRFWYLATVIDVRSREILGWHVANHHTTVLVIEAFKDAARRTKIAPIWFHSDQGSEYVSGAYESLLAEYDTRASQSRKGSPWQNKFQESFYSQFKLELGDTRRFGNVDQLIEAIYRQIRYYNHDRIHSAHDMPPAVWRINQEQKMTALAVA